jgi:hypothetical protein
MTQIEVATFILEKLNAYDGLCKFKAEVAGGAPRDWYLGRKAKDIDVFFHADQPFNLTAYQMIDADMVQVILSDLGFVLEANDPSGNYESNPNIYKVWNCEYKGEKVQFIFTNKSHSIDDFVLSTSKAKYSLLEGLRVTDDFVLSHRNNVHVETGKFYANTEAYKEKMKAYFPEYRFITKEQAYNLFLGARP